jgi:hypothetical protein
MRTSPHVEASKRLIIDYGFDRFKVTRFRNLYKMDMVTLEKMVAYSMQEEVTSEQIREIKDYIDSQPISDEMKERLLDLILGYEF